MDEAMSDEDRKELEDLIQEDDEGLVDTSISEGRNVVDILPLVQPSILTGTTTEIIPAGILYTVSKLKVCFCN